MDRLTSLEVVVAIVESGSFTGAAERLNMSRSMVSAHLARLEDRLGTPLLRRSTRRMALTQQGHLFVGEVRAVLAHLHDAEQTVRHSARVGPSGRVAIDCPGGLGTRYLVPAVAAMQQAFPAIAIDLSLGDRSTTWQPEGFDMVIRIGSPPEGRGEVHLLGQSRLVLVGSPNYLAARGEPGHPDELHDHATIQYHSAERARSPWRFSRGAEAVTLRPRSVASFNHGDALSEAAKAGMGLALTLELLVANALAEGSLRQVMADWATDPIDIHLFVPQDRILRPAVRVAAEFLRDTINWQHLGSTLT